MPPDNRCILGLDDIPREVRGCALTIGNFDGVHLGHQRIIQAACSLAAVDNSAVVAMTFEPPPERVLHPEHRPQRIMPNGRKCCALLEAGASFVVMAQANRQLLGMPPLDFIEEIIIRRFGARHVVEGYDFHFGARRAGDVGMLGLLGCHYGFATHVVDPVMLDLPGGRQRISSTLIRQLISQGEVELARGCLGRPFTLYGPIVRGEQVGMSLGFPTANLEVTDQVLPGEGVYAGRASLGGEDASLSREFVAAISIGRKPTLGASDRLFVEAFLIGAGGELYGRPMSLSFFSRLRGQTRFDNVEELKRQIAADVRKTIELVK